METAEKFKNSPMHDKRAIIQLLDLLNPEQMCRVVEFSQKLVENSKETEKEKQPEVRAGDSNQQKLRNTEILYADLTVRSLNCLHHELGISYTNTVESLETLLSKKILKKTKGLGRKSFIEIELLFEEAGMIMRDN